MSANSYGIVVEGGFDSDVYSTMIRRLARPDARIHPRSCGGRPNLLRKFPSHLEGFKFVEAGRPVDMAVVIVDADGKDPDELERSMRSRIANRKYPFRLGVQFHAVQNAMEAWLLSGVEAIARVVQSRTGRVVTSTHGSPQLLLHPKPFFRKLLIDHGIDYTSAVATEIAQHVDLQVLSEKCSRFTVFARAVDC